MCRQGSWYTKLSQSDELSICPITAIIMVGYFYKCSRYGDFKKKFGYLA